MSDGATDGASYARAFQERQDKYDRLFRLIVDHVTVTEVDSETLAAAFDVFDEARYAGYGPRASLELGRGQRRSEFLAVRELIRIDLLTVQPIMADELMRTWAEILTLGLLHASDKAFSKLRQASPFRGSHVALHAPTGYGGRGTRLYGDLEAVLDHMAGHDRERDPASVFKFEHTDPIDGQITKLYFIYVRRMGA